MRTLTLILALVVASTATRAQDAQAISVGQNVSATITGGAPHVYRLELEAGQFVTGRAFQRGVDIVVEVTSPHGVVASFDSPNGAQGPEPFQFASEHADEYRITVRPFAEGTSGDYDITVIRAEPLAGDAAGRVRQMLWQYDDSTPGVAVGVVRDGNLVFEHAIGLANLGHEVPFQIDTRSNIGSVSKQFTAMAILLLEQQGRLSLDDDVRRHVPELPDLGHTVTIRHLLSHTSGYREILNTLALAGRRLDEGDYIDPRETIEVVRRQQELQNLPGEQFNYNNTGYELLALVVERAGEMPFHEWMERRVFQPLGMTNTMVRPDAGTIVPHGAQGYAQAAGGYVERRDLGGVGGAGGIYTTVADMARWMTNFRTGQLGGATAFGQMSTPYVLTNGVATEYGMGLSVSTHRGRRMVSHGGADIAHRAMVAYFPELDAGVVVMSNDQAFAAEAYALRIADEFFGADFEPEDGATPALVAGDFDPESYDPTSFDQFVGRYELESVPGFILAFTRDGDRLITQATGQPAIDIRPTSDSTFVVSIVDAGLTFHRNSAGEVLGLTLDQNGSHRARRLPDASEPAPVPHLAQLAGRYYSDEIDALYVIEAADGGLTVSHRRWGALPLRHRRGDEFAGPGIPIGTVTFERDAAGAVTGLRAGNGRTLGVWFERME